MNDKSFYISICMIPVGIILAWLGFGVNIGSSLNTTLFMGGIIMFITGVGLTIYFFSKKDDE